MTSVIKIDNITYALVISQPITIANTKYIGVITEQSKVRTVKLKGDILPIVDAFKQEADNFNAHTSDANALDSLECFKSLTKLVRAWHFFSNDKASKLQRRTLRVCS